jgi:hypothetical protein|nr:MAG TPA: hypothetical protein [Caudoviricetes sp.]
MERLTQRENDKLIMVKQDNGEYIPAYWDEDNFKAIKKLADYEDLEARSLLVRLPCKVGTEVYYILGVPNKTPCAIDKCVFKLSDINKIGKTVFLTREEAEKKLEEMKNEI